MINQNVGIPQVCSDECFQASYIHHIRHPSAIIQHPDKIREGLCEGALALTLALALALTLGRRRV